MSPVRVVAASLLFCSLAACASAPRADRERELLQRDRDWAAMAGQGTDVERILAFWSDDAVVIPPGEPVVRGKKAIREYVQKALATPGFQIHFQPATASVSADGTMGHTTGENSVTFPGPDGKLITIAGRYSTIWRREPGGEWRCVVDIWNSGP
jgi:ketosteroid isomerase-like protein